MVVRIRKRPFYGLERLLRYWKQTTLLRNSHRALGWLGAVMKIDTIYSKTLYRYRWIVLDSLLRFFPLFLYLRFRTLGYSRWNIISGKLCQRELSKVISILLHWIGKFSFAQFSYIGAWVILITNEWLWLSCDFDSILLRVSGDFLRVLIDSVGRIERI